jgi:formamidopyrimidine-DNA glycosylase
MPELPEVETVARSLRPYLEGNVIQDFEARWPKVVENATTRAFRAAIKGARIQAVERRAKYMILRTDRGRVLIHLRMTGRLYPQRTKPASSEKHVSALFLLKKGEYLVFHDTRKFGRVFYYPDEASWEKFTTRFGPEPLERGFTPEWLVDSLKKRKRIMKPLLLDQEFIAGLGNIYVDESLWMAGIHPLTRSDRVPRAKIVALHQAIKDVLRESIRANGTTFSDFKFLGGKKGGYTDSLKVFQRQGEVCPRCERKIEKMKVAQRGTHVCRKCQPPPRT